MLNEDPKKIPSSGGVSGEATAVAQRQRSRGQTGWVAASKPPPAPGPDGPCPPKGDRQLFIGLWRRTSPATSLSTLTRPAEINSLAAPASA